MCEAAAVAGPLELVVPTMASKVDARAAVVGDDETKRHEKSVKKKQCSPAGAAGLL